MWFYWSIPLAIIFISMGLKSQGKNSSDAVVFALGIALGVWFFGNILYYIDPLCLRRFK